MLLYLLFTCRYMKTSSVMINVAIIVSCMMLFMTNVLLLTIFGSKKYKFSGKVSNALCYVRLIFVRTSHVATSIIL